MKISSFIFTLFLLGAISACRSPEKIFKDQNAIPPNFGSKYTTLLVVKLPRMKASNNSLEKAFAKEYKGEYVIIEQSDLSLEKYQDLEKYGYIFEYTANWQAASGMGDTRSAAHWEYSARVLDRNDAKTYGVDFSATAHGGFFSAYAHMLEVQRAKNALVIP